MLSVTFYKHRVPSGNCLHGRRMISIRSIRMLLILLVAFSFIAPLSPSYSQQRRDTEQKINALLARMSPEEKLGQLQQLDAESNGNFQPDHRDLLPKALL